LLVIPMYLDTVIDGMLKGLNQQMSSLKYNICDSLLRVAMILCIVPFWGSVGYIAMLYISELFNLFLSYRRLAKVSGMSLKWDYVTQPVIFTATAVVISGFAPRWWGMIVYVCTYLACAGVVLFMENKQNQKK